MGAAFSSVGQERCEMVASIPGAKTQFLQLPSKEPCSSSLLLLIPCACCALFRRPQCCVLLNLPFSHLRVLACKGAYLLEGDLMKTPSGTSSSQIPTCFGNRGPNPSPPQLNSQRVERRVAGSRDPWGVASMPLTPPPPHPKHPWRVGAASTAVSPKCSGSSD